MAVPRGRGPRAAPPHTRRREYTTHECSRARYWWRRREATEAVAVALAVAAVAVAAYSAIPPFRETSTAASSALRGNTTKTNTARARGMAGARGTADLTLNPARGPHPHPARGPHQPDVPTNAHRPSLHAPFAHPTHSIPRPFLISRFLC
mmetsp:Transcript_16529/g.38583  ORF Transcript_16529/g.38583 Transcript_16529/m.38583 type:complete len:150 (-) Transcript_16529:77-526(-)